MFVILLTILLVVVSIVIATLSYEGFSLNDTMDVYIISLPSRRTQRLDVLLRKIQDPWFRIVFTYGVRGSELDQHAKDNFSNMTDGQIGCWLSHYTVWNEVSKYKNNYALVLEDDADCRVPEMTAIIKEALDKVPSDWDVLFLGGMPSWVKGNIVYPVVSNLSDGKQIKKVNDTLFHTHAYIVSSRGAAKMLGFANADFNSAKMTQAVDLWMSERPGINCYIVEPNIVNFVHDVGSDT